MKLLGYSRWENFEKALKRAMEFCETAKIKVLDHFREVTKMVSLGSGANRKIKDYMLTRYAFPYYKRIADMFQYPNVCSMVEWLNSDTRRDKCAALIKVLVEKTL